MSESAPDSSRSTNTGEATDRRRSWTLGLVVAVLAPIVAAAVLYRVDSFDPAAIPAHVLPRRAVMAPRQNARLLSGSETVGHGQMLGQEDLAYDPESQLLYTGCADGWIKRVSVNASAVENWVNTGGRPLGLALTHNSELIVADAYKGLLRASTEDGKIELLTKEAEGVEFRLTDGVDVAEDGTIYFTDASSKYSLEDVIWDFLEGRPYGRLMSYDPSTKQTKVLVRDLYFANGVAVSPDQSFVVFCESPLRRCQRYYIKGEREGKVDPFVDNLPAVPDNVRYDGDGRYWIALSTVMTVPWDLAQKYPVIRKGVALMERYLRRPHMERDGGVFAVDLDGNPTDHCHDPQLSLISGGLKIGDHLYIGSLGYQYIIRLNLTLHPALPGA